MQTRFLVAVHSTVPRDAYNRLTKGTSDLPQGPLPTNIPVADWAPEGEPVIPNFPIWKESYFLGIASFKPCPYAKVMEIDLDLDEAVKVLKLRYPGLPESMLGKYVLETAKTAWELPTNAIFRISIEQDKVELFGANVSKTYVMWDKQPT